MLLLSVLATIALISRLVVIQILDHGFYKALAQGQQSVDSVGKGLRGNIYLQDKKGNLYTLATNREKPFAFVSPVQVQDKETTAQKIAEMLGLDLEEIQQKLQRSESLYELLKRDITQQEQTAIANAQIPGLSLGKEMRREYPQGVFASHVIGFTNQDGKGQYGIEEYYDELLAGKEGIKKDIRKPASFLRFALKGTLQNGADLFLTIDYHIQSKAEVLLKKAKESLGIEGGTIIVGDPTSGRILAMASIPSFDPNEYSKVQDIGIFQNPGIQKMYEPGSIFKPITMAVALNEGKVKPDTLYTDEGVVRIGGRKIYNYDQRLWGKRTMTEVLEYSINTGAVFAEQQAGHEKFLEYIKKFGILEPTRIDLSGETFSTNKEFQKGYEINFATASFGQGIEMTSLQVMRAFAAIANGGMLPEFFLGEKASGGKKDLLPKRNTKGVPVISPQTSWQLTAMLVNVVENGFAKAAKISGYHIAGKTGTAQIPWSALGVSRSGYSDKTIQSFVGYAPAFDPQFLVVVKLDNPQTKTAEYSAVPIFRELAKYIIDYYAIPPDYEGE